MPGDLLTAYAGLEKYGLVCARLAGLILFQPLLTSLAVPPMVRALLVIGLGAMMTPFARLTGALPDSLLSLALALGQELLLGALLGLATIALFLGLQYGGMLIAQESGLAYGQIIDPTLDEEENSISSFCLQLGAVVFFTVGAHRAIFAAFLDTFTQIPLLSPDSGQWLTPDLLIQALWLSGEVGVQIAAPTVLALSLVNIALGFISRTMPQLNVTTIGFSLKTVLSFAVMGAALPSMVAAFTNGLAQVTDWIDELVTT